MEGKFIVASGPVIVRNGKILAITDNKDDFYKLPGGTTNGNESLEETCLRQTKYEIGVDIRIIKPLEPLILWENPKTKEKMTIILIHYLAEIIEGQKIKPGEIIKEVKWLNIEGIKKGKYKVGPNLRFLADKINF